jgi:hypothetical protein
VVVLAIVIVKTGSEDVDVDVETGLEVEVVESPLEPEEVETALEIGEFETTLRVVETLDEVAVEELLSGEELKEALVVAASVKLPCEETGGRRLLMSPLRSAVVAVEVSLEVGSSVELKSSTSCQRLGPSILTL